MFKNLETKTRFAALFCLMTGGLAANPAVAASTEEAFSLDQLYTLPRLTGTSPESFVWTHNSKQLAFLWNDKGLAFRDLWICQIEKCEPRPLTNHAEQMPENSLHGGISEALWRQPGDAGLIYVLNGGLHAVDRDGKSQAFEYNNQLVTQLGLSPDGRMLSFVNGGPTDNRYFEFRPGGGLWLRDSNPDGVAAKEVVVTENDAQYVESYAWSADSRTIAFVMADRSAMTLRDIHYQLQGQSKVLSVRRAYPGEETTNRRIGIVDVESQEVRWLLRSDTLRPIWSYGLSSDGTQLFVNESDFLIKEHVVDIYNTASGARESFYRRADPSNTIPAWQVAWAPNDDGLILLTDIDGYYQLYHQRKAGGKPQPVTRGEWEIADFSVDAKGKSIYFVSNEAHLAEQQIYRVPLSGGKPQRLSRLAGTHAPVYAPDYSAAAVRFSSDTAPAELYMNFLNGDGGEQRITHSPIAAFDDYAWARVSYPTFKSHIDGTDLTGRLLVPTDFDSSQRYPLVVGTVYANTVRNTWGGGSAIPIWGLDQHLVSQGYVVLSVDVRGSWGHGTKFSQGLLGDYGGIDTDDIESGVRHLLEQGFVDPERIGIWGWSYGGLMTLMSLAKKPDLYAVGIADAPATNVWHAFPEQMWVMGERKGPDYPARYERLSALYQTDLIEDPVMILHGTADAVVMYADSIAFIEKLISREALYEFVPMPGTSHVWAEGDLARQRFGYKKMVDFLNRHLKPEGNLAKPGG